MINLFEYIDYRVLLKDFYEQEKRSKPYFSYRFISGRIGLNPGYIVKLLQGKIHLGVKHISAFADLLHLQGKEREYFEELVHFGRAKHQHEVEQRFDRLQSIKGVRFRTIKDHEVAFFSEWYHMVIRALITIYSFDKKSYKKIASFLTPRVSAKEVKSSLQLQKKLGLITIDENGKYRVTEQFVSSGEKWTAAAIRNYQRKNMELAISSLEKHHKNLRDISTVTMTFTNKDLNAIRERIKLFRQELLLMTEESTQQDSVYQINIQFFPVALNPEVRP